MYVEILKALADEKRLQIMCLLFLVRAVFVKLNPALKCSQSSTSKHLIKLKQAGLLKVKKKDSGCTTISQRVCFPSILF